MAVIVIVIVAIIVVTASAVMAPFATSDAVRQHLNNAGPERYRTTGGLIHRWFSLVRRGLLPFVFAFLGPFGPQDNDSAVFRLQAQFANLQLQWLAFAIFFDNDYRAFLRLFAFFLAGAHGDGRQCQE